MTFPAQPTSVYGTGYTQGRIPTMQDYNTMLATSLFAKGSKIPTYAEWVSQFYNDQPAIGGGSDPYTRTITDAYNTYLGRDPETEGFNYWRDQLSSNGDFGAVLDAIKNSPEAQAYAASAQQRSVAPDLDNPLPTPRSVISNWYQQYLGRAPEQTGWDYWTNAAYNGTPLSDIQSAIQNSSEGQAYAASQPRYDVVYNADGTVYNPLQDKNGVYNADGDQTPPDLVTPFPGPSGVVGQPVTQDPGVNSPSDVGFGGSQYGAFLTNMYNQYLGRNPEAEGFNNWSAALSGGASEDSIRNAIANSDEAQKYAATQAGLNALG